MKETTLAEISPSVVMKRSQFLHDLIGQERYKELAEHELFWRADGIAGLKEVIGDYREMAGLGKYKEAVEIIEASDEAMALLGDKGLLDTIYYLSDMLVGGNTFTNLDDCDTSLLTKLEGKTMQTSFSKGGNKEIDGSEKKKLIVGVLSNLFVLKKMGEEVREDSINLDEKRRIELSKEINGVRVVVGEINGVTIAEHNKRARELWKDESGSGPDREFLEKCLYDKLCLELKSSFNDIGNPRRDENLFSLASQIFSEAFVENITDEVFSEEGRNFVRNIITEMVNTFLIEIRRAKINGEGLVKAERMISEINGSLKVFEIVFEGNAPDLRVEGLRENFGNFSEWIDEVIKGVDVSLTEKDSIRTRLNKLLVNYSQ